MEELIKHASTQISFVLEATAIIVISIGGFQAIFQLGRTLIHFSEALRKQIWQSFAIWLMLGLEFMLAGDIIRTAITPTWDQLGQLAVIALIRTFLNYFLEKDLGKRRP
jgi:uncharacterized membrane protein